MVSSDLVAVLERLAARAARVQVDVALADEVPPPDGGAGALLRDVVVVVVDLHLDHGPAVLGRHLSVTLPTTTPATFTLSLRSRPVTSSNVADERVGVAAQRVADVEVADREGQVAGEEQAHDHEGAELDGDADHAPSTRRRRSDRCCVRRVGGPGDGASGAAGGRGWPARAAAGDRGRRWRPPRQGTSAAQLAAEQALHRAHERAVADVDADDLGEGLDVLAQPDHQRHDLVRWS